MLSNFNGVVILVVDDFASAAFIFIAAAAAAVSIDRKRGRREGRFKEEKEDVNWIARTVRRCDAMTSTAAFFVHSIAQQ